jgi:hypothetical protein
MAVIISASTFNPSFISISLSYIIDTHWGLQYWEPMKKYFGCNN